MRNILQCCNYDFPTIHTHTQTHLPMVMTITNRLLFTIARIITNSQFERESKQFAISRANRCRNLQLLLHRDPEEKYPAATFIFKSVEICYFSPTNLAPSHRSQTRRSVAHCQCNPKQVPARPGGGQLHIRLPPPSGGVTWLHHVSSLATPCGLRYLIYRAVKVPIITACEAYLSSSGVTGVWGFSNETS